MTIGILVAPIEYIKKDNEADNSTLEWVFVVSLSKY